MKRTNVPEFCNNGSLYRQVGHYVKSNSHFKSMVVGLQASATHCENDQIRTELKTLLDSVATSNGKINPITIRRVVDVWTEQMVFTASGQMAKLPRLGKLPKLAERRILAAAALKELSSDLCNSQLSEQSAKAQPDRGMSASAFSQHF